MVDLTGCPVRVSAFYPSVPLGILAGKRIDRGSPFSSAVSLNHDGENQR